MKQLAISLLIIGFAILIAYGGWKVVEYEPSSSSMKPVRYQEGNITYLIFGGGKAVVNYTQDSLDYEFLHSPTKTIDYGKDNKGQTEQAEQSVRTIRTSTND